MSKQVFDRIKDVGSEDVRKSISYSRMKFLENSDQGYIRSYAIERNNKWRNEMNDFLKKNKPRTERGTINNDFYKFKFRYDVVVPKPIYEAIMCHYITVQGTKEGEFISKYMDHIMMFCQAIHYYNGKYVSYVKAKKEKTPLYIKLIYSLVGRYYKRLCELLIRINVLDIDMTYLPAYLDKKKDATKRGMCRHYGFRVALDDKFVIYQITNRTIITRAYDSGDGVDYENGSKNIISDLAMNDYFSEHFELSKKASKVRHLDYEGYGTYFENISEDGSKFKNLNIGRDRFGNRLYHPFCYMKKALREYVKINGKLANKHLDINNSHPYFFSMLFDNKFLEHVSDILTEQEIILFQSVANNPLFQSKVKLFKQLTSSGCYYVFLRENIKTDWDIKKLNMCYFYGKVNKRSQIYKFFDKNFNFINIVKHSITRMGDYKRLCQILQRVEARVMVDGIFLKLMKSGLNVIPLHDCISCTSDDYETVVKVVKEEFESIGVEYLPAFDKNLSSEAISGEFDKVKKRFGSLFLNKGILLEQLNALIKMVGINNRVFKEGMKTHNMDYIDRKFEDMKHLIDDGTADKYYELRIKLDSEQYDDFDYEEIFEQYKKNEMMKKKWYSREIVGYVKINPIEFYNMIKGTNYKTRVKESNYVY